VCSQGKKDKKRSVKVESEVDRAIHSGLADVGMRACTSDEWCWMHTGECDANTALTLAESFEKKVSDV